MLKNYFKIALKVLVRRKFFTFISLFGISFTLLVLMVVTALLDNRLSPMAPESRQPRILGVYRATMYGPGSSSSSSASFPLLDRYARGLDGVERLSIYANGSSVPSYVDGAKVNSSLKRTDGEFWNILDFTFIEGAPYTAQDVDNAAFVAVINERTRTRFFGEGQTAMGRTIELDGQRFRVVGVVANVSRMRSVPFADVWAPLTTFKTDSYKRGGPIGNFNAIALAADVSKLTSIREQFNERLKTVPLDNPKEYTTLVAPFESKFDAFARERVPRDMRDLRRDPNPLGWRLMWVMVGLALLFLLLPTVNLININVSRIMERASEIGVRKAFGASSRTLVGQFVVENVILTVIGGMIGFVLSIFVLRAMSGTAFVGDAELQVNLRVFLYGLALAVVFGLLSGVYPAWRMSRLNPVQALRGASR